MRLLPVPALLIDRIYSPECGVTCTQVGGSCIRERNSNRLIVFARVLADVQPGG